MVERTLDGWNYHENNLGLGRGDNLNIVRSSLVDYGVLLSA